MKIATNEIMKGIVWLIAGWALCFHWYEVNGLWGQRNELAHIARVTVTSCEHNAAAAKDNGADTEDLKRCPKAPVLTAKK